MDLECLGFRCCYWRVSLTCLGWQWINLLLGRCNWGKIGTRNPNRRANSQL